jgi:hypothetical protein
MGGEGRFIKHEMRLVNLLAAYGKIIKFVPEPQIVKENS